MRYLVFVVGTILITGICICNAADNVTYVKVSDTEATTIITQTQTVTLDSLLQEKTRLTNEIARDTGEIVILDAKIAKLKGIGVLTQDEAVSKQKILELEKAMDNPVVIPAPDK